MVWLTAFVHLGTGLLWSWQLMLAHCEVASRPRQTNADPVISSRQVLVEIRREVSGAGQVSTRGCSDIERAVAARRAPKWPGIGLGASRTNHGATNSPNPPWRT